jgi:hypothetical protein
LAGSNPVEDIRSYRKISTENPRKPPQSRSWGFWLDPNGIQEVVGSIFISSTHAKSRTGVRVSELGAMLEEREWVEPGFGLVVRAADVDLDRRQANGPQVPPQHQSGQLVRLSVERVATGLLGDLESR